MKCFLYFEIAEVVSTSFNKEKILLVKELFPHIATFDFDNASEPTLKSYALELIKSSEKKILFIEILSEPALNGALGFIEKTIAGASSLLILINKPNSFMKVLAEQYGINLIVASSNLEIKDQLKDYFDDK